MRVANDKRDRRQADVLSGLNRRRFEQEVAEEIGISLDRKGLRRRRTGGAAPAPGASGFADRGQQDRRREP